MPTIVIDPCSAGWRGPGGSRGVRITGHGEAAAALDLARRIRQALEDGRIRDGTAATERSFRVHLTHEGGSPAPAERAAVAMRCGADLFLSLGFNCSDGTARGTEAWIDRKYRSAYRVSVAGGIETVREGPGDPTGPIRNINHVEDGWFAAAMARACYEAIGLRDDGARLCSTFYDADEFGEAYRPPPGVRMREVAVLEDAVLGTIVNNCRACLLDVEFLDHPRVDALFNGPDGNEFRDQLAAGIARALVDAAGPQRRRHIPPD